MECRVPYSQQFTPVQTPLHRLLPILRQKAGARSDLRQALAAAFFKTTTDPLKMAGNTLISLRTFHIIDKNGALTDFGNEIISYQGQEDTAHKALAKHILINLNGLGIVETLREMASAGLEPMLKNLPGELAQRGIKASNNSSDLSAVLDWLRKGGVLNNYEVIDSAYKELIGTQTRTLDALKSLSREQIAFVRALIALNISDWVPYNMIGKHAEGIYPGEVAYNWKDVVGRILFPLREAGLIEVRKKAKQSLTFPSGRGGKPTDVRPTKKLEDEISAPLLESLYRAAGFATVRELRSLSMKDIVDDIRQKDHKDKRGKALEHFVVRLCQLLDLEFMGWRETDQSLTGGGEIDAMFHSRRLVYSRWQIQCKVGAITLEAVAKEVGMQQISLANIILIVGTEKATDSAKVYRDKVISKNNLNIILIDGPLLDRVIKNQEEIVPILNNQAYNSFKQKPAPLNLRMSPPSL